MNNSNNNINLNSNDNINSSNNFNQNNSNIINISRNNNINLNNISQNNKKSYEYSNNKIINIYPYKFQAVEKNFVCKNINENKCNNENITVVKSEKDEKKTEKFEGDKSLIEFLVGKPKVDSKDKKGKNNKLNIHNKRKKIKFRIVKKEK